MATTNRKRKKPAGESATPGAAEFRCSVTNKILPCSVRGKPNYIQAPNGDMISMAAIQQADERLLKNGEPLTMHLMVKGDRWLAVSRGGKVRVPLLLEPQGADPEPTLNVGRIFAKPQFIHNGWLWVGKFSTKTGMAVFTRTSEVQPQKARRVRNRRKPATRSGA
jgi:hypothetical protein